MTTLYCLTCPVCGDPPGFALDPTQAFCANTECPAFTWNMTKTRDENLDETNFIDLSGMQPPEHP